MGNFKSSLVDGDFKVTGKTWLLDGNHIHTFNGESGKSGYVHFAQIKITGSYQNQPVIFDVIQRDRRGRITLLFKSLQGNDPVIVWFIKSGNINVFAYKSDSGIWDLYIDKSEAYDSLEVSNLQKGIYSSHINIIWKNDLVTSLPDGYITANIETQQLNITGNAGSSTQINTTLENPTSTTWYAIPFHPNVGTGNRDLRNNNGLLYGSLEGTTSDIGISYLTIGNASAAGTAGNKKGKIQIYSEGKGFVYLDAATTSNNYTITFPAASGTVSLNGHTHNYLPLSGGNMTGNINFLNGNNMGIYWKENGYGDKFKICPAFSGSNDDNLLKIQGAVGDTGTDPSLYDLVTISGKSGNVKIKGSVQAPTFTGSLSGNASSATKATQDGNGNTISSTYLKLAGGTMTGDLTRKVNKIDASLSNNNISSSIYPTTFNILDKSNRIINRIECIPKSSGNIDSYWYVRNYKTDGTMVAQKGITMSMNKSGTLTYNIADPSNFRDAINIKAMSASSYSSSASSLPNGSLVAVW